MSYTQLMHRLHLIVVGGTQETWQKEAILQYQTRIRPFAKLELIELPDERESSTVPVERLRAREAEAILKRVPEGAILIVLDELGREFTSPQWANLIESEGGSGETLVFAMGGANGLDPELRKRARHTLSLGKQTMPHVLARIVLLEQLYRAETILHHKVYHR